MCVFQNLSTVPLCLLKLHCFLRQISLDCLGALRTGDKYQMKWERRGSEKKREENKPAKTKSHTEEKERKKKRTWWAGRTVRENLYCIFFLSNRSEKRKAQKQSYSFGDLILEACSEYIQYTARFCQSAGNTEKAILLPFIAFLSKSNIVKLSTKWSKELL